MTLGARARRAAFWSLDRLHGGPIRRDYQDIRSKMTDRFDDRDQLDAVLEHATRTTDFYRPLAGADLDDFPVVSKADHKRHGQAMQSSAIGRDGLHVRTTSGSTGTPVEIGQDARKRRRAIADTIYFNEVAGLHLGDRFLWLQSWRLHRSSRLDLLKKNVVPVDILQLDDSLRDSIIDALRDGRVHAVLSFASVLSSLARRVEARGIEPEAFDLHVIISTAETLQPHVKQRIEETFGCPVVNRYANEECGVLACSTPSDDRLFLNRASFHFEFLRIHDDEPAAPGEMARVVVTDLYGFAAPLIRYDTADLARVDELGAPEAIALRSVEGRTSDVVNDVEGRQIPPAAISYLMAQRFPRIAQYQLVQVDASSYRFRIALGPAEHSASDLTGPLHDVLGMEAHIDVEFLDEIPSEASGKYRPVVNQHLPRKP